MIDDKDETGSPADDPTVVHGDETRTSLGSGPAPAPSSTDLPELIGQYRITGKLGEGGMGVVYEAEQQNPRRKVALKVIRGGRTIDANHVRMFQREVDTLARLEHPDIAAIYESGCTDEGQHYFAMELIRGETLDSYMRSRPAKVDTQEARFRLLLARRIAEAVHYAHQRGVIHRDIKPSNIVVMKQDTPSHPSASGSATIDSLPGIKILDFGLARITEGDLANATMATEVGAIKGTLAYMAPEQARGRPDDIDVRVDVYALGVVFYEMLAGSRPYSLAECSITEALRVIEEKPPQPLRQLRAELDRLDVDIETILQKALEKDADRRYAGAAELSADITRYLNQEPILARPPSTLYLMRKLVARHRLPAAMLASLVLLLIGFGVVSSILLGRALQAEAQASEEAETATQALTFMTEMFEVSDPSQALGDVITAREVLDRGAERIELELAEQPRIRSTLMTTMGMVYGSLGLNDPAVQLLEQAAEQRRELLGPRDEDTLDTTGSLARIYLNQGRFEEGRALIEEALEAYGVDRVEESAVALGAQRVLADAMVSLARFDEAEAIYRRTLEGQTRLLGRKDAETLTTIGGLSVNLTRQGRFDEAKKLAREVLEQQQAAHGEDHPETYGAKNELSLAYLTEGLFAEAESLLLETVDSAERIAGPEHPDTLVARKNLLNMLREAGRYDDALALCDGLIEVESRVRGPQHPETLHTWLQKAIILQDQQRLAEAEPIARKVYDDYTLVLGPDHPRTLDALNTVGMGYLAAGRTEEAEPLLLEHYEARARVLGSEHPDTAMAYENYGNAVYQNGREEDVPAILERVLEIRTRALGERHPASSRTRTNLGVVLGSLGRNAEAQEIAEREYALLLEVLGPDHPNLAPTLISLGQHLYRQERYAEGVEKLREAARIQRGSFGERSLPVAATLHNLARYEVKAELHDAAEQNIREAASIREAELGPEDADTLLSRFWTARVLHAQERREEAVAVLTECYETSVRANVTRYPLARESARLLSSIYSELGDETAATEWSARVN